MPSTVLLRTNALKQLLTKATVSVESPCSIIRAAPVHQTKSRKATPQLSNCCRDFTQTSILSKKKGKSDREKDEAAEPVQSGGVDDPFDYSSLETGILKALEKLKNDLSKLRTGGRFNPEQLENVKVHLRKESKDSIKLGELAQVLPKGGRSLMVLVGEKDHVKPIMAAIQASKDLNLQPQPDSQNSSQLNIQIPPPTKESRDLALIAANKAGDVANIGVRNARATMQKRLRAMELKRVVRPDDLKKAHKEMEKVVEKGVADVKKSVDAVRKTMEQS